MNFCNTDYFITDHGKEAITYDISGSFPFFPDWTNAIDVVPHTPFFSLKTNDGNKLNGR